MPTREPSIPGACANARTAEAWSSDSSAPRRRWTADSKALPCPPVPRPSTESTTKPSSRSARTNGCPPCHESITTREPGPPYPWTTTGRGFPSAPKPSGVHRIARSDVPSAAGSVRNSGGRRRSARNSGVEASARRRSSFPSASRTVTRGGTVGARGRVDHHASRRGERDRVERAVVEEGRSLAAVERHAPHDVVESVGRALDVEEDARLLVDREEVAGVDPRGREGARGEPSSGRSQCRQ